MSVLEIDAVTGVAKERELTPDERAQHEADEQAIAKAEHGRQQAEAAREAALEKLAALGLTRDDLTALGL